VPTASRVEYCSVTVNVPLAGGTLGALSTLSVFVYVTVIVVDVTDVAVAVVDVGVVTVLTVVVVDVVVVDVVVAVVDVVLVAICMLYVVLANLAAVDESPTGKAYMYMRGAVTPHTSTPTVERST
jgi:hypothetical protein